MDSPPMGPTYYDVIRGMIHLTDDGFEVDLSYFSTS